VIYFQTVLPPISSYAISKIAAEQYLRLSGVPLTIFRLAAVYGPRNLSGPIPTFYRQVAAGEPCTVVEDATRDFVFVEDLVERVLLCISNSDGPVIRGGTYDVRTGSETRIKDIPYFIGELLGVEPIVNLVPRRDDDVAHYEMNGVPRIGTPFIEGLGKAIEWYAQNGVTETHTHLQITEKNAS
jgi:UDP-glucose 4-epimerase